MFLGSLGIIGGADGPTAVYMTTSVDSIVWTAGLLILAAAGIIWWRNRRSK